MGQTYSITSSAAFSRPNGIVRPSNYCFLNGLFSWVPQKYDKVGSLIVVHDLPGLVVQNGNGQVSAVAVVFFFPFAAARFTASVLNGLFSWVPQKYDKVGSLTVVHDLPG